MSKNYVQIAVASMLPVVKSMTLGQRREVVDFVYNEVTKLPHEHAYHAQLVRHEAIKNIESAIQDLSMVEVSASPLVDVKRGNETRFMQSVEDALSFAMIAGVSETVIRQVVK